MAGDRGNQPYHLLYCIVYLVSSCLRFDMAVLLCNAARSLSVCSVIQEKEKPCAQLCSYLQAFNVQLGGIRIMAEQASNPVQNFASVAL